jgi:hypothetical protein
MTLAARQRTDRLIEEQNQRAQQQQAMFLKPAALRALLRRSKELITGTSSASRNFPSQVQQQCSGQFRQPYIIQSGQQMLSTGIKKINDKNIKIKKICSLIKNFYRK